MLAGHAVKPAARSLGLATSTVRTHLRCAGIRPGPRHLAADRLRSSDACWSSRQDLGGCAGARVRCGPRAVRAADRTIGSRDGIRGKEGDWAAGFDARLDQGGMGMTVTRLSSCQTPCSSAQEVCRPQDAPHETIRQGVPPATARPHSRRPEAVLQDETVRDRQGSGWRAGRPGAPGRAAWPRTSPRGAPSSARRTCRSGSA